jgi:SAM-dependent methyltransferase
MAGTETERLEQVAGWYSSRVGFYSELVRYGFETLRPHLAGRSCLELGPADGQMTPMLLDAFEHVTSVDGSSTYCEELAARHAGDARHEVVCSLFEDFVPQRPFDVVLGTHVLEHVEDPVEVLGRARDWVAPGGRMVMLVPNALSLHRLVAVEMGMLERPDSLNDLDVRLGHRRVYDLDLLEAHVREAGWEVTATGGNFLKPLSNGQMEAWFTPEMLDGFHAVGRQFPRHAAEVYVVAVPA